MEVLGRCSFRLVVMLARTRLRTSAEGLTTSCLLSFFADPPWTPTNWYLATALDLLYKEYIFKTREGYQAVGVHGGGLQFSGQSGRCHGSGVSGLQWPPNALNVAARLPFVLIRQLISSF